MVSSSSAALAGGLAALMVRLTATVSSHCWGNPALLRYSFF